MKIQVLTFMALHFAGTIIAEPEKPDLSLAERQAIVAGANRAIKKHLRSDPRRSLGDEIAKEAWGEAIARLKPLRVRNDRINVFIVLEERKDTEDGLYVAIPVSSYAPGLDQRFVRFEKLTAPGDRSFGSLYRCRIQSPAAGPADEPQEIQGCWLLSDDEYISGDNSQWIEAARRAPAWKWDISADKIVLDEPDPDVSSTDNGAEERIVRMTYVVDATQSPPTIDLTGLDRNHPQQVTRGIYKLYADKLIVCLSRRGSEDRPADFSAKAPAARRYEFTRKAVNK